MCDVGIYSRVYGPRLWGAVGFGSRSAIGVQSGGLRVWVGGFRA